VKRVALVAQPYDSGLRGFRMGTGVDVLLGSGLVGELAARGFGVAVTEVSRAPEPGYEIRNTIALDADLASLVRAAVADARFLLVLAGNYNSAVGTTAAIDGELCAVWFDAHADFDLAPYQARRLAASDVHVVDPAALERGELGPGARIREPQRRRRLPPHRSRQP
jgi:arginase family enzyme